VWSCVQQHGGTERIEDFFFCFKTKLKVARQGKMVRKVVLEAWKAETLKVIDDGKELKAGPGECAIRIEASAVQSTDIMIRQGLYPEKMKKPPMTTGCDFTGIVEKVGEGVAEDWIGKRVTDLTMYGGHASSIVRPVVMLTEVPQELSPEQATCLTSSWLTAFQLLHRTKAAKFVGKRQTIFVQGGAGAVGQALIILANKAGCRVFATARPKHHELLRTLGAIPFDYKEKNWVRKVKAATPGGKGAAVAFDGIGADAFSSSKALVRSGGVLMLYGTHKRVVEKDAPGIFRIVINVLPLVALPSFLRRASMEFYSITKMREKHPQWFTEDLSKLLNMLKDGEIDIEQPEEIHLEQIDDAHARLAKGGLTHRIVVLPNSTS